MAAGKPGPEATGCLLSSGNVEGVSPLPERALSTAGAAVKKKKKKPARQSYLHVVREWQVFT